MRRSFFAIWACFWLLTVTAPTLASTQLLTIDVRDVDISDVIAMLAAQSGVNVVTDGSVKPERVTLRLHGVTFDEALRVIASAHALQVRSEGGILIVGAAEAMNRRAPGVVFSLRHAQPDDVAKELADVLPVGTVIDPDKRSASIMVAGDDETLARARRLVAALDSQASSGVDAESATQAYTVAFPACRRRRSEIEGSRSRTATFLADEDLNAVLATGGEHVQAATRNLLAGIDRPSAQVLFEVKVADVTPINDASNFGLEFGGIDLQGQPLPGAVAYNFVGGTIPVNVTLNAMVSKGRAQILATPKLVTVNNKEADLTIGETYPIVYSTSVFGGQNVQYVDIGVHLRLTPTIGIDGTVTAELHPEYSELVGFTPSGYPIVANRKIDSTLRVERQRYDRAGRTHADTSSQTVSKIPGLSEIPILGKLFQNKQTSHERDEIVFLITPHVIYPGGPMPHG